MTRTTRTLIAAVLVTLGAAGCGDGGATQPDAGPDETAARESSGDAHWSYEGATGPENWGELEHGEHCDGEHQSPIDLAGAVDADLADIEFAYAVEPIPLEVHNNGHTVAVTASGSEITIPAGTYPLAQFHFHAGSEHTIDGVQSPLEMHLVHVLPGAAGAEDRFAVIGVMFDVGEENAALAPLFEHLPTEITETPAPVRGETIDVAALLPEDRTYFRYDGSLTTPPCTEGVAWHVMAEPLTVSQAQLDAFTAVIDGNARPVQPLGARTLERDDDPVG